MTFALPSSGVEVLSSEELAEHCALVESAPDSDDAIFCIRYIQGFIDGAVATDERVTHNVAEVFEQDESFADRAIRTRRVHDYISARLGQYGPSLYAEFCLGEPVPLREVVDHVVERLSDGISVDSFPSARDLVYATLRTSYPCQTDD